MSLVSGEKKSEIGADAHKELAFLPNIKDALYSKQDTLSIAQMAERFQVTHRTLHFYEEKSLLFPSRQGVRRVYPPEQVSRMAVINACRETGLPVLQIQDLMSRLADCESQREADILFQKIMRDHRAVLFEEHGDWLRKLHCVMSLLEDLNAIDDTNDSDIKVPLTELELKCLRLIVSGYGSVKIAQELQMEVPDYNILEKDLVAKFGVEDRFQAVARALLLGIVARDLPVAVAAER